LQAGNDFGEKYEDYAFINIPLATVTLRPHPPSTELTLDPRLTDICAFARKCFNKIIEVNSQIPAIEKLLFKGWCLSNGLKSIVPNLFLNLLCNPNGVQHAKLYQLI